VTLRCPAFRSLRLALTALAFAALPLQAQVGAASSGASRAGAAETNATAAPRLAVDASRPRAFAALSASMAALRDSMVTRAQESIGIKYLLGGNNPLRGLDCSALIRHIVSAFDISLPRTAQEQARMGREIPKDRNQMRPGDLLTFGKGSRITHIGMYVGEGRFIHASTSRRRVIESSLDQTSSSLIREWKGVRRLVDGDFVAARYDSMFAFLDSLGITGGDSATARGLPR
jgi:cell wall-associated NlpC family hydrolase